MRLVPSIISAGHLISGFNEVGISTCPKQLTSFPESCSLTGDKSHWTDKGHFNSLPKNNLSGEDFVLSWTAMLKAILSQGKSSSHVL